jgi:flagellar basal body-associated protein FliL
MNIKSKKGAEIALNTIIIAIIILVVLVIVIAFFAGGSSSVIDKIKSIFTGKTAGQDISIAIQSCQEYCDQAKQLQQENPSLVQKSPYCTYYFKLDIDPKDGNADKTTNVEGKNDYIRYFCSIINHAVNQEYSQYEDPEGTNPINVGCSVRCQ